MKKKFLSVFFVMFSLFGISQGELNEFDYDNNDINFILNNLGFHTFKFPVKYDSGDILEIIVEVYKKGEKVEELSNIESMLELYKEHKGYEMMPINIATAQNDTVIFKRFYFQKQEGNLNLSMGTSTSLYTKHFDISDISVFNVRARSNLKKDFDESGFLNINNEKQLLLLYGNSIDEKPKPLWCPYGLSKEELISNFYFVIFVSIRHYEK